MSEPPEARRPLLLELPRVLHGGRVGDREEGQVGVQGVHVRVREHEVGEALQVGLVQDHGFPGELPRGDRRHLGLRVGEQQTDQVPAGVTGGPDNRNLHSI